MDRVGISFKSLHSAEEVREQFVKPLRTALDQDQSGFYSNYLRQADKDPDEPVEHLLIFEVNDFKLGLHLLRTEIEKLGPPEGILLHNLAPSSPGY